MSDTTDSDSDKVGGEAQGRADGQENPTVGAYTWEDFMREYGYADEADTLRPEMEASDSDDGEGLFGLLSVFSGEQGQERDCPASPTSRKTATRAASSWTTTS